LEKIQDIQAKKRISFLKQGHLPVMEKFYTLQGEGYHTGEAAYFIRLAGCDVGCVWCDVKESWQAAGHPQEPITGLVASAMEVNSPITVITGGEPAMYDLTELTQELQAKGKRTHIETSGVHPLTGNWHWVCLSPKKFRAPAQGIHERADELKVVIYHKSDFAFAEEHAAKVGGACKLFLQPEWGRVNQMLPLIIDYVKEHPQWRISLQTHKYMNIP
jgi:7-carboxy-7-deazaguanine synthase